MYEKLLLSCLIMLSMFWFSCSQLSANKENGTGNDNNTSDNATRQREKMIANNELINRAIETGNFNGIDTLWTNDIVDHTGPMGKEVRGKDSVMAELKQMNKTMKDIKIETKAAGYDADKGYLFTLSRLTATTTAPMDDMPANTKVDMTSVDLVQIKNGKASDHWTFPSMEDAMKMMAPQKGRK